VITRVDGGSAQPLVLCLPAPDLEAGHPLAWGAAELKAVLQESDACRAVATETEGQKRAWWAARLALDARLTGLCTAMDTHWLGAWRAALQGAPAAGSAQAAQAQLALQAGLARLPPGSRSDAGVAAAMAVLARGAAAGAACADELGRALGQLGVLPAHVAAAAAADMLSAAATAPAKQPRGGVSSRRAGGGRGGDQTSAGVAPSAPPGPVLLLLDSSLTALPWESMPGLEGQRISRVPSLGLLAVSLAARGGGGVGVDLSSAYFLLNPGGDLPATQARLQPLLSSQAGWDGVAGALPGGSKAQHAARLAASPLFLYFGHGAGTQFLPSSALRLRRCATTLALLMGCSSGALVPRGDFPPAGAALAYLAAGCASLVANLWDVTDKDIDRFAEALLHAWLQHAAADGGGQQGAGAGAATAVHTGLEDARRACKLRALTGAAPVCYGLPTLLLRGAGGRGMN
jgi:separase